MHITSLCPKTAHFDRRSARARVLCRASAGVELRLISKFRVFREPKPSPL